MKKLYIHHLKGAKGARGERGVMGSMVGFHMRNNVLIYLSLFSQGRKGGPGVPGLKGFKGLAVSDYDIVTCAAVVNCEVTGFDWVSWRAWQRRTHSESNHAVRD